MVQIHYRLPGITRGYRQKLYPLFNWCQNKVLAFGGGLFEKFWLMGMIKAGSKLFLKFALLKIQNDMYITIENQ